MSAGAAVEFCMSCEMELKVHGEKRAVESPGSQADSPGDSAGRFSPHYGGGGGGVPHIFSSVLCKSHEWPWRAVGGSNPPNSPVARPLALLLKLNHLNVIWEH